MSQLAHVVEATYEGGYRIKVRFEDGVTRIVNFEPWLDRPIFEPLKNIEFFRTFCLDGGTVAWSNGADVAPETLYESVRSGQAI